MAKTFSCRLSSGIYTLWMLPSFLIEMAFCMENHQVSGLRVEVLMFFFGKVLKLKVGFVFCCNKIDGIQPLPLHPQQK